MLQERTDDHVTWLTFDRPTRLNSFTVADYRDLRLALQRAIGEPTTHAIVLTGNGRAFSAGADRSLLDSISNTADRTMAGEEFTALLGVLSDCGKPLLAAVNGLAVGFGCTMLLYCDIVLAAESARFRLPFTALGIVPEAGSTVLLPARARWDATMWATLTSDWIDASTARDMGMVWRVVADSSLLDAMASAAATIAAHDPSSVAATKRLLTAGRATAARQAIDRENGEMERLRPRTADGRNAP
jgi:enoyl-CoA hydratase/carnithine racemase